MKTEFKEQILVRIQNLLSKKGESQNKLADKLGISSANLSNIVSPKRKWDKISDDFWRKLASHNLIRVDYSESEWQVFETRGLKTIHDICEDAQENHRFLAGYGKTGAGKTEALRIYASEGDNVGYVLCDVLMTQKGFLNSTLESFGIGLNGTKEDKVNRIADNLRKLEKPLWILDDLGKVRNDIYPIIQLVFDRVPNLGIGVFGVEKMKEHLDKMKSRDKMAFPELHRRIEYWQNIPNLDWEEIKFVCEQYGIADKQELHFVKSNVTCFGTLKNLIINALRVAKGEKITLEVLQSLNLSN
ncbi:AAA family ATPase [Bernardetia sp. Wsw4-3y2]|uniref:AAA family ATPase n=1 Tax=Bernardetia sp. Wsw4-3y2 TaxID=3127471 RepID=UPI0030D2040E